MDITEIIDFCHRFIFFHPFVAMGITAGLAILIYIKPKQVLKIILIFLAVAVVCYIMYLLWQATQTGYLDKEILIHKDM